MAVRSPQANPVGTLQGRRRAHRRRATRWAGGAGHPWADGARLCLSPPIPPEKPAPPKPLRAVKKRVQKLSQVQAKLLEELKQPGHFIQLNTRFNIAWQERVFTDGASNRVTSSPQGWVSLASFHALQERGLLFLCLKRDEEIGNPDPAEFWATEKDKQSLISPAR